MGEGLALKIKQTQAPVLILCVLPVRFGASLSSSLMPQSLSSECRTVIVITEVGCAD